MKRMKRQILNLLFLFVCCAPLHAQVDRCPPVQKDREALHSVVNERINVWKGSRVSNTTGVLRIPVVVHIIHNNANGQIGGSNISEEQVLSQIEVLNEDYRRMAGTPGFNTHPAGADMEIEFFLAPIDPQGKKTNGINRVYSSRRNFNVLSEQKTLSALSYWDASRYLNIWVSSLSGGYLGYAEFPFGNFNGLDLEEVPEEIDGVYIDYRSFGRKTGSVEEPYAWGRTATHEVGHWLGLLHTWGDSFCGTDYCDDTPQAESANRSMVCTDIFSNCRGRQTRNMIENFLDYTVDSCMNVFTQDQKSRVRAILEISQRRKNLIANADLFFGISEPLVFKILGNPVTKEYIECKIQVAEARDYDITVVDPQGRVVYSVEFTSAMSQVLKIPKSRLGSGLFFLRLRSGTIRSDHRLLVL